MKRSWTSIARSIESALLQLRPRNRVDMSRHFPPTSAPTHPTLGWFRYSEGSRPIALTAQDFCVGAHRSAPGASCSVTAKAAEIALYGWDFSSTPRLFKLTRTPSVVRNRTRGLHICAFTTFFANGHHVSNRVGHVTYKTASDAQARSRDENRMRRT